MGSGGPPRGTFDPVVLTNRRPPIERWLAVIVVVLVLVVSKPWQSGDSTSGPGSSAGSGATRTTPGVTADASRAAASQPDGAEAAVAAFCLNPGSWLVASVERWRDQRIRVWRALEPAVSASGPGDPSIPIVSVASQGVTELGWCAPVVGPERPSIPVTVDVWLQTPSGPTPTVLDSSRPDADRSAFGALYRPPGRGQRSRAGSWAAGTYVFRYREHDGRERWFAVEVEIRPGPTKAP